MSQTRRTEGVILKRTNFGEADRILTIYTKHFGKLRCLAKGVRKMTSRKGGNVELFNQVTIFLAQGKNLDILTEVQMVNTFKSWRKNLLSVGMAYYLCELIDRLTPDEQPSRQVFELLSTTLPRIGKQTNLSLVRSFEEQLLNELGFGVPDETKKQSGSLKNYIESIIEKELTSAKVIKQLS